MPLPLTPPLLPPRPPLPPPPPPPASASTVTAALPPNLPPASRAPSLAASSGLLRASRTSTSAPSQRSTREREVDARATLGLAVTSSGVSEDGGAVSPSSPSSLPPPPSPDPRVSTLRSEGGDSPRLLAESVSVSVAEKAPVESSARHSAIGSRLPPPPPPSPRPPNPPPPPFRLRPSVATTRNAWRGALATASALTHRTQDLAGGSPPPPPREEDPTVATRPRAT